MEILRDIGSILARVVIGALALTSVLVIIFSIGVIVTFLIHTIVTAIPALVPVGQTAVTILLIAWFLGFFLWMSYEMGKDILRSWKYR